MQRTKLVPKTKIEMGHRAWNVFEGHCLYGCWYCWSCANKRRFKEPEPLRWNKERFQYRFPKKPCRILVCWTMDLMHPDIPSDSIRRIIARTEEAPHCTFLFLTKNPARYAEFHFPKNCWLGVTVTSNKDAIERIGHLFNIPNYLNQVLFASAEPLLEKIDETVFAGLNWVIVGPLTGVKAKKHRPQRDWIENILSLKKMVEVSIFLKNKLAPIWDDKLIQEYPKTEAGDAQKGS